MPMAVEITSSASGMKKIFDLCDKNGDGLIKREDFKSIGGEYFDEEQVEKLLELMDPCNTGDISFIMFCRGVETFLLETDYVQRSESGTSTISCSSSDYIHDRSDSTSELTSDKDGEETISSDDIYPVTPNRGLGMSNGYLSTGSIGIEIAVDSPEDCPLNNSLHSISPRQSSSSPGVTKESPTMIARHLLMTRQQQQLNMDSPSQGSTPAEMAEEAEEEVTKLSVEVSELNSRLQEFESEQKDQEGYRTRLKKENRELKQRLEEYEDMVRMFEQNNEELLKDSEAKLKTTRTMLRVQSEKNISELSNKLAMAAEEESKCKDREATLRLQLIHLQEKVELKEEEIAEMTERQEAVQLELRRARDELRVERAKWKEEMDTVTQLLHDRDEHISHLQAECEDMRQDHKETSITASDMDGEVNRLKKLLEEATKRNDEWEAQFLRQGQTLVADSAAPSLSLEAELENVSKDEVMDALKESEEKHHRLQHYLDTLLCNIMTKHPELLEIH